MMRMKWRVWRWYEGERQFAVYSEFSFYGDAKAYAEECRADGASCEIEKI